MKLELKRQTLYVMHIVAKLFFAVALLFFPVFFHGLYGNTYSMNGIRLGRYLAFFMIVVSYLAYRYREDHETKQSSIFSQATAFEWGIIGVFFLIHTLQGGYNFMGWVTTGLCAVFTVLFVIDSQKVYP